MRTYKRVLSIAGSDSGGGAGIQADLKTISACGCFAMTAITTVTAQNTLGVKSIDPLPVRVIEAQIRACLDDIGANAVKIGMLHSIDVIRTIVRVLRDYPVKHIVVDPVMVATSSDLLVQEEAIAILQQELFPLASVITPNTFEIEILSGMKINTQEDLYASIPRMKNIGARNILLKAGHLECEEITDVLVDYENNREYRYTTRKIDTVNTHGTGCSLSSAVAAYLAHDYPMEKAVKAAIDYLHGAIEIAAEYRIGHGHGAVHHFYKWWK
ncbi:bifunctional hydroxymethylpyrimidine kinase/phosphomethylpyrimidine kinase [Butyricimonas synergistica]|uniref:bifunctional hydroxymethylpyrimidine kinase/phosphomethylpyrimidine kinase n=1 Tax=Butyricimonas synergistica TaxID=544644 RepID=UPI00036D4734|nr:bifunctional hydroxymethylpyrimidine kinase/phosphomethylpyrimidine kinase [Butyricimonas synergistica]